ncbi:uncharacterized protein TRAVEDRAFT_80236, partial [Trametes versicolor FP-101664 SS1]|uniref:uncharacterized protein n=1 Tax=Trametes versicolor (strain FP-101664) TaxID=717944 RepID=UPI00046214AD
IEVYDSGATRHISPYRERFETYERLDPPRPITAANGDQFMATGEGDMRVRMPNGGS